MVNRGDFWGEGRRCPPSSHMHIKIASSPLLLTFFFFKFVFYVNESLPACISVYHVYTSHLRPEEGITSPGSGVKGPPKGQPVLLTARSSLRPPFPFVSHDIYES